MPCSAVRIIPRKYSQEEIEHAKAEISRQLGTYKALVDTVSSDGKGGAALAAFEEPFFNNLILALDRPFVHRLRMVAGKDGNPLNEVEMPCASLKNNGAVLKGSTVIKPVPGETILKLEVGDPIRLSAEQFERLSAAFFAELESKFL